MIYWKVVFGHRKGSGVYRVHDEESRNGRDVKIDILDDYIWTSERFRVIRVFFGVPGSYGNTGEEVYGPYWALRERERQAAPPID